MLFFLLFIKTIVISLGFSLFINHFVKKKIGKIIPLTYFCFGLIMYFSGIIISNLLIGYYLIIIISLLGICIFVYDYIKDKSVKSNNLSLGLYSYLIIVLIMFIYCYKYQFSVWDEFSHWGPHVRTMFDSNVLYTLLPKTSGAHIEYPPLISLLELFFCKLYGFYSESICSLALHIFEFSIIFTYIFDSFENKSIIEKTIFSLICIVTIILFDRYNIFRSIYLDITLSLVSVYPIIVIVDKYEFDLIFKTICISLSFSFLLLTKELGIAFYLCDLFYYLYYLFFIQNIYDRKIKLGFLFSVVFFPMFIWFVWNRFSSFYVPNSQFNISALIKSIDYSNLTSLQIETIYKLINFLLRDSIIIGRVKISYICFFTILIIISLVLFIIYKKKEYFGLFILFFISNIGYILLLIVLYCYCFSPIEMENINSFDRYLSSLNIYCILILFIVLFDLSIFNRNVLIVLLIVFVIINKNLENSIMPSYIHHEEILSEDLSNTLSYIDNYIDEDSLICIFSYDLIDIPKYSYRCNFKCNFVHRSLKEIITNSYECLTKYDYVIFSFDDLKTINDLLLNYSNSSDIYNNILYKVSIINDEIRLIMMC